MSSTRIDLDPYGDRWESVELTEDLIESYSLRDWSNSFSLMTAGYRDQLDPQDAASPEVAFNILTLAILGEAKARTFRERRNSERAHVHIGGETRPHTQEFIAILARVYASHGITVHLRSRVGTTPIWYSSFGVFYEGFESGESVTASHSQYFKGGWKPLDSEGKQLVDEEQAIIAHVQEIVRTRATIRLAPWRSSGNILPDFDVDSPYLEHLTSVVGSQSISQVAAAGRAGFRCAACPLGGSMKATTELLFQRLGITTGEAGVIRYFYGEEDPRYHRLGEIDGENFGADPTKWQIYRNIGAQGILLRGEASCVFAWDPDGDRFNIITVAPATVAEQARDLGLEVEAHPHSDLCIVYFSPNQIFFMLTAHRIATLRSEGLLDKFDWFITRSVSTSRALDELAKSEQIPVACVRVGFKYTGSLARWAEDRTSVSAVHIGPDGSRFAVGPNPRALIMCEESGGAVFGGTDLLRNKGGSKSLIAMREKDGMQLGVLTLTLAASLFRSKSSFAEYYSELIQNYAIRYKHFHRLDVKLYDEGLTGAERRDAKANGLAQRDQIMKFFRDLSKEWAAGVPPQVIQDKINALSRTGGSVFGLPRNVCDVGDGTLLEFDGMWCLIRASGTDAVVRYYIEGEHRLQVKSAESVLTAHGRA